MRGWLSFPEELPEFETGSVPDEPYPLFADWLGEAGEHVLAPHAVILSTMDEDGPDARVVVLRDAGVDGWAFSTSLDSPKARQLAHDPRAALTFFWPGRGRQVRLRGHVVSAPEEDSAADYDNRSPASKAEVLIGHQSEILTDRADLIHAGEDAERRLGENPDLRPETWQRYLLVPTTVEFWQAATSRRHVRLRYHRTSGHWIHTLLWP